MQFLVDNPFGFITPEASPVINQWIDVRPYRHMLFVIAFQKLDAPTRIQIQQRLDERVSHTLTSRFVYPYDMDKIITLELYKHSLIHYYRPEVNLVIPSHIPCMAYLIGE